MEKIITLQDLYADIQSLFSTPIKCICSRANGYHIAINCQNSNAIHYDLNLIKGSRAYIIEIMNIGQWVNIKLEDIFLQKILTNMLNNMRVPIQKPPLRTAIDLCSFNPYGEPHAGNILAHFGAHMYTQYLNKSMGDKIIDYYYMINDNGDRINREFDESPIIRHRQILWAMKNIIQKYTHIFNFEKYTFVSQTILYAQMKKKFFIQCKNNIAIRKNKIGYYIDMREVNQGILMPEKYIMVYGKRAMTYVANDIMYIMMLYNKGYEVFMLAVAQDHGDYVAYIRYIIHILGINMQIEAIMLPIIYLQQGNDKKKLSKTNNIKLERELDAFELSILGIHGLGQNELTIQNHLNGKSKYAPKLLFEQNHNPIEILENFINICSRPVLNIKQFGQLMVRGVNCICKLPKDYAYTVGLWMQQQFHLPINLANFVFY
jgi:hypothetical protein